MKEAQAELLEINQPEGSVKKKVEMVRNPVNSIHSARHGLIGLCAYTQDRNCSLNTA